VPGPWRNGGGSTRELAAWPAGDDWTWRISVAEVASSGPFSRFEGVERWFAVLDGAGVTLDIAGERHQLSTGSEPLRFDGGAATDCTLVKGPTQDFNLMVKTARAQARMQRLAGDQSVRLDHAATVAIYAVQAARVVCDGRGIDVRGGVLLWQTLETGATVDIAGAQALWMEIRI